MHSANLPAFCTQPAAEALLLLLPQSLTVVYERTRDFLSAPRAFVVLQTPEGEEPIINSGSCHLNDEQWTNLQEQPYGIYTYSLNNDSEQTLWLLYGATQLIEIQTTSLAKITEIYHQPTATHALIHFLGSQ